MFNDGSTDLIQSLGLFFSAACTSCLFIVNVSLSSNIVFLFFFFLKEDLTFNLQIVDFKYGKKSKFNILLLLPGIVSPR